LEEIVEKDGLENEEMAKEFFDMCWDKLGKSKVDARIKGGPEFLDINAKPGFPYESLTTGSNDY